MGGTSGYFGELRGRSAPISNNGESSGAVSFMQLFDTATSCISQGSTRRGSFAAYLDIDHPDIEEFLQIKEIGNPIQNLFYGVCIPDYWMKDMIEGDMDKRNLWAKVLQSRQKKGLPYIFFTDNVNKGKPEIYKDLNIKIRSSNLCSEIALPSTEEESFVCCLSSLNIAKYDEWKDTDVVERLTYFLDAVMSEYIHKARNIKYLDASVRFAERHRSIGIGVLGYHSYLQSKDIPFESFEASMLNARIFRQIKEQSYAASEKLAESYGPAPIFSETINSNIKPRRNTTLMAVAPTTSSSAILGQVSPGIEPYASNYYKAGLSKGNFMRINPYLKVKLRNLGKDTEDVWRSIMNNGGSVQHLDFLDDHTKKVFKTFKEINQMDIITQAAQRQQFIDQSQSLNLNIPPDVDIKTVNKLFIRAWELGVKTLYYQRSESVAKSFAAQKSSRTSDTIVECSACES